jgi:hypothetical protein
MWWLLMGANQSTHSRIANSTASNERPGPRRSMDDLGFVEPIDRLGECIVIGVADAADRGFDAGVRQPLGISDRQVLRRSLESAGARSADRP